MHFALPPRKGAQEYARAAARSSANRRRKQFQLASYFVLGLLTLYLAFRYTVPYIFGSSEEEEDGIEPKIVIVTVLDEDTMSKEYIRKIKANRDDYASRHGYSTWYTNTSTYFSTYQPAPKSWATIPALRHALTLHPEATHLFYLTPNAMITNISISLTTHILEPARLGSLMIRDVPVVPPDSVIHTFSHITPSQTNLILTQDIDNLAPTSFLLRNTDWSRFFLDAWFDPLYRSYNFQKAELHALEHMVQWHPTILAKLVLVPQRIMNSYNIKLEPSMADKQSWTGPEDRDDGLYRNGDLLVVLKGCDQSEDRACEGELQPYWEIWKDQVNKSGPA